MTKNEMITEMIKRAEAKGKKVFKPTLRIDNHGELEFVFVEDKRKFHWDKLNQLKTSG